MCVYYAHPVFVWVCCTYSAGFESLIKKIGGATYIVFCYALRIKEKNIVKQTNLRT